MDMNKKIKEAMETALRALENYEKDGAFYGVTYYMAVEQLKNMLRKI
jgi:hypothetical protein